MTIDPLPQPVYVNQRYSVPQGQEPGVVISMRDYERLIERLEGCKQSGWGDLWLAGVGVGAALAIGALVVAVTLPVTLTGTRDVLWALTGAGVVIFLLCLAAYFTQRREHAREVDELKKDLVIHKDRATAT